MTLTPPGAGATAYGVEGCGTPDVIVVAEGAGGKSAEGLPVERVPTSPGRLQIAGVVAIEGGGEMKKRWRHEDGKTMITGTMSRKGSGKTWIVSDVSEDRVLIDGKPDPNKIEAEFRRLAAEVVGPEAATARVTGPIEGQRVGTLTLQQQITKSATYGSNVVGFGDFVGNAHWSVGGGMQVGAVSHGEALKDMLLALDRGAAAGSALALYNGKALEATMEWNTAGFADFMDALPAHEAAEYFLESIRLWRRGFASSPLQAQEAIMPEGRATKTPLSSCRILNGLMLQPSE